MRKVKCFPKEWSQSEHMLVNIAVTKYSNIGNSGMQGVNLGFCWDRWCSESDCCDGRRPVWRLASTSRFCGLGRPPSLCLCVVSVLYLQSLVPVKSTIAAQLPLDFTVVIYLLALCLLQPSIHLSFPSCWYTNCQRDDNLIVRVFNSMWIQCHADGKVRQGELTGSTSKLLLTQRAVVAPSTWEIQVAYNLHKITDQIVVFDNPTADLEKHHWSILAQHIPHWAIQQPTSGRA